MPFGPHRSSSPSRVEVAFRVKVGVRGEVPAGTGPSGLEKRRSCNVQLPMRF